MLTTHGSALYMTKYGTYLNNLCGFCSFQKMYTRAINIKHKISYFSLMGIPILFSVLLCNLAIHTITPDYSLPQERVEQIDYFLGIGDLKLMGIRVKERDFSFSVFFNNRKLAPSTQFVGNFPQLHALPHRSACGTLLVSIRGKSPDKKNKCSWQS